LVLPFFYVRELNAETWSVINAAFDGERLDCFQGPSVRLSFTGYTFPLLAKPYRS
jgi:hypothetical protein